MGGTLPSSMGNISMLKKLTVVNNNLSGRIPSSFKTMQNLGHAAFGFNYNLTGFDILCPLFTTGAMRYLQSNCNPLELAKSDCKCCTDCCYKENNTDTCCFTAKRI